MSRPVVVIAEDEPRLLRSVCFLVEREGGRPVGVGDGHAAWAAVLAERPALVILDVMMAGLDGFEVCRRIRATASVATTPVIIVTALGQEQHRAEALAAGADRYLRKPFDVKELRALVIEHLTRATGPPGAEEPP